MLHSLQGYLVPALATTPTSSTKRKRLLSSLAEPRECHLNRNRNRQCPSPVYIRRGQIRYSLQKDVSELSSLLHVNYRRRHCSNSGSATVCLVFVSLFVRGTYVVVHTVLDPPLLPSGPAHRLEDSVSRTTLFLNTRHHPFN